jgi:hypothetical protein
MMPQLETGPQKWVVLGPTGLFRNALNAADMAGRQAETRGWSRPATTTTSEAARGRSPWTVEEEDWLGTIPRSGWSDGNWTMADVAFCI